MPRFAIIKKPFLFYSKKVKKNKQDEGNLSLMLGAFI